jgi:hypothetical protein
VIQNGDPQPSEDLGDLGRLLRRVRFQPRASLGAELLGRVRRGEQPTLESRHFLFRRLWPGPLMAAVAAILAIVFLVPDRVTVDRCCYDLDGGGTSDDGTLIVAERDGRVYRLSVYEDLDGSSSLTPADIVRYDRRGTPSPDQLLPAGRTRIQHCCQDLDGGGPADDGILVLATPPDRVHTAAIYQLR